MSVDMSDYTDSDPGSIGYEIERTRREGYALADDVERSGNGFAAAWIRDEFRRRAEQARRLIGEARDDFLRQEGFIP